jgi:acetolactate synthase-1/3 small subunit
LDYTETRTIARELLLAKVSILGPEYLEEQLQGGQHYAPRPIESSTMEQELAIARHFEHSGEPNSDAAQPSPVAAPQPLTPTEVLAKKHSIMQSVSLLASQFGGKIVDVSTNSVVIEMTGKTSRVDAFLSLLKPFGVLESARTGNLDYSLSLVRR